jgi:hypothetical protein
MPRSSKFTSSGLQRLDGSIQRNHPKVTRKSFRKISDFEGNFLFSNPTYRGMSPEKQALIQQNAQKAFFDWINSNRFLRITTKPHQNRKMYEGIVQNLLISTEIQSVAGPAFGGAGAFDLPVVDVLSRSCVSPFESLHVTGVITSSHQVTEPMPTYCLPYSQPLSQPMSAHCSRHSDGEEGMFPNGCMLYSKPLSPTLDSSSFMHTLPKFAQLFLPTYAVVDECDEDAVEQPNSASVFPMLQFPGLAETLQQISETQDHISRVVNEDTVDMSLGPIHFLPSDQ